MTRYVEGAGGKPMSERGNLFILSLGFRKAWKCWHQISLFLIGYGASAWAEKASGWSEGTSGRVHRASLRGRESDRSLIHNFSGFMSIQLFMIFLAFSIQFFSFHQGFGKLLYFSSWKDSSEICIELQIYLCGQASVEDKMGGKMNLLSFRLVWNFW